MTQITEDPLEVTQIPVTKGTRQQLRELGRKGDSYDDIIQELIKLKT